MNLRFLAVLAVCLLPVIAHADIYVGSFLDRNTGELVDAFEDEEGDNWFIVHHANGAYTIIGGGRPTPDGAGRSTPASAEDVANALKKVENAYTAKKNPEQTVIGNYMNAQGKGFAPRGNPGDTGYGSKGIPNAPGGNKGPTQEELARQEAARNVANMNARGKMNMNNDMSGGIGGGGESPGFNIGGPGRGPGQNPNQGQGSSGDGSNPNYTNSSDNTNKTLGETESLGPRPDLVNPAPIAK